MTYIVILFVTFISLYVLTCNELLSLACGISRISISICWIFFLLFAVSLVFIFRKKIRDYGIGHRGVSYIRQIGVIDVLTLLLCVIIGFMSVKTIPYNWDSMTYHLTRLAHWEQNGSIAHYACHDISQISDPYLAEFINLHVYILCAHNGFVLNLLQTFSMYLCAYMVYSIARKIGCNSRNCALSALVFVTTPIVFGEALSTQVDLFSSVWLLFFTYISLDIIYTDNALNVSGKSGMKILLMGIVLGLSYATKPTVIFAEFVIAVWLVITCIKRKDSVKSIIKAILYVAIGSVLVVAAELIRNIRTFGSFAAEESSTGFILVSDDIRIYTINFVKNLVFNLGNIHIDISAFIYRFVRKVTYVLMGSDKGADIMGTFFINNDFVERMNHDQAVNPIVICLLFISSFLMLLNWKKRKSIPFRGYVWVSYISFFVFCIVVRWYEFIVRYEIGYFALIIPAAIYLLQVIMEKTEYRQGVVTGILLLACMLNLGNLYTHHKAYLYDGGDIEQYWFSKRWLYNEYCNATESIIESNYKNVGLITGADTYEYPIWEMLNGKVDVIEHVDVNNATSRYARKDFLPDILVVIDREIKNEYEIEGQKYILDKQDNKLALYKPE